MVDQIKESDNGAAAGTAKKETAMILQIEVRRFMLGVRGISPLIVHAWSAKAKRDILDQQTGRARKARGVKDPEADYQACFYLLDDGSYGFPALAFKKAAVRAAQYADMKMTWLRGAFFVDGDLVKIEGEPHRREDMVRVMGKADIRFRPEFPEWSAELPISYNARVITPDIIVNLMNIAGFSVGVGEGRPERDNQFGRFEVVA